MKQKEVVNKVKSRQAQNGSVKEPELRFLQTCSLSTGWIEIDVEQNKNEKLRPLAYCTLNMSYYYAPAKGKKIKNKCHYLVLQSQK